MIENNYAFYAAMKYLQDCCDTKEELYCSKDQKPVIRFLSEKGVAIVNETRDFYGISIFDLERSEGVDSFTFFKNGEISVLRDAKTNCGKNLLSIINKIVEEKDWYDSWKNQIKPNDSSIL